MPAACDVAVVGAGMAGIAAAERLSAAGLSVIVLEARDRIGGRACTDTATWGVPLDLGAQWLHTGPRNPLVPLVRAHGFRPRPHRPGLHYRAGDRDVDVSVSRRRFEATVRAAGDVGIAKVFDEQNEADRLVSGLECSIICGTDSDHLSALDWATMVEDGRNDMIAEGLGRFVQVYARAALVRADLRLGCPVHRIDWTGAQPSLSTPQGSVEARAMLLTVPNGVLASGHIQFAPSLPDWKQSAIEGLPMGLLNKVAFRMDRPVDALSDGDHLTLLRDDGNVVTCLMRPLGLPYAIVFLGGRHAAALEADGAAAMLDCGRDTLHRALGSAAVTGLGTGMATRWGADPWSRGAYATARPGAFQCRADLARPVDGRLFFAGEATETVWAAQLAGAWLSGLRAADEIVASLG